MDERNQNGEFMCDVVPTRILEEDLAMRSCNVLSYFHFSGEDTDDGTPLWKCSLNCAGRGPMMTMVYTRDAIWSTFRHADGGWTHAPRDRRQVGAARFTLPGRTGEGWVWGAGEPDSGGAGMVQIGGKKGGAGEELGGTIRSDDEPSEPAVLADPVLAWRYSDGFYLVISVCYFEDPLPGDLERGLKKLLTALVDVVPSIAAGPTRIIVDPSPCG